MRTGMEPLVSLSGSLLAITAIIAARYLAVSGAFAWATRIRKPGLYRGRSRQIRREFSWSLTATAIYGLPAGVAAWGWQTHGWTRIYTDRSEEHTSELQSLMRISYAVFCLTKKKKTYIKH